MVAKAREGRRQPCLHRAALRPSQGATQHRRGPRCCPPLKCTFKAPQKVPILTLRSTSGGCSRPMPWPPPLPGRHRQWRSCACPPGLQGGRHASPAAGARGVRRGAGDTAADRRRREGGEPSTSNAGVRGATVYAAVLPAVPPRTSAHRWARRRRTGSRRERGSLAAGGAGVPVLVPLDPLLSLLSLWIAGRGCVLLHSLSLEPLQVHASSCPRVSLREVHALAQAPNARKKLSGLAPPQCQKASHPAGPRQNRSAPLSRLQHAATSARACAVQRLQTPPASPTSSASATISRTRVRGCVAPPQPNEGLGL